MYETRKQITAFFDCRVEVLDNIRNSLKEPGDTRPYPRETFNTGGKASLRVPHPGLDPECTLTEDEVNLFMKSHKQKFYLLEAQVALALTDKIDAGCGTDQRGQRQYGCFSGNAQEDVRWLAAFTQEFLRTETFVCRMLPPLRPWPGPRPGPVEL